MEIKNWKEPKWIAIGLTVLVLVGGAWKVIASMSGPGERSKVPERSAKAVPIPENGSYVVYDTSWGGAQDPRQGESWQDETLEIDPNDPDHMPYELSEEDRAFALKAAKTWRGLPIAIEGRE